MTENDEKRFVFTGHAIGAGAHIHRLDNHTGLNHLIPALGASALPVTGGLSQATAKNYQYSVEEPVRKTLLSVGQVDTKAHGHYTNKLYQTDILTTVEQSTWVERVHLDLLSLTMETTHNWHDSTPIILIKDLKIQGLTLGSVTATVEIDDEPFSTCGTKESIEEFWAKATDKYRQENMARFPTAAGDPTKLVMYKGYYHCSAVRKITLKGPDSDLKDMRVDGNVITWDNPNDHSIGFGKIILGEILIRDNDRRVTLARMQMGCPVGGSGSGGEGQSNGGPGG